MACSAPAAPAAATRIRMRRSPRAAAYRSHRARSASARGAAQHSPPSRNTREIACAITTSFSNMCALSPVPKGGGVLV